MRKFSAYRATLHMKTMLSKLLLLSVAGPGIAGQATADASRTPAASETRSDAAQTFSIFMLVRTTEHWLRLAPKERFAFLREDIEPILAKHPQVRMRFFDSEGYNSRASDVVLWETADLRAYQSVIDALRETRFWGHYFEVIEIVPSVENAYAEAYDERPVGAD